jgi:hypothetical protein
MSSPQQELPIHRLVPRRLQQPQRKGQTVNSSGVSSSAASPSTPTGMDGVSVVIVCCAVGHAATNARPLMSRPVPRTSLAATHG